MAARALVPICPDICIPRGVAYTQCIRAGVTEPNPAWGASAKFKSNRLSKEPQAIQEADHSWATHSYDHTASVCMCSEMATFNEARAVVSGGGGECVPAHPKGDTRKGGEEVNFAACPCRMSEGTNFARFLSLSLAVEKRDLPAEVRLEDAARARRQRAAEEHACADITR